MVRYPLWNGATRPRHSTAGEGTGFRDGGGAAVPRQAHAGGVGQLPSFVPGCGAPCLNLLLIANQHRRERGQGRPEGPGVEIFLGRGSAERSGAVPRPRKILPRTLDAAPSCAILGNHEGVEAGVFGRVSGAPYICLDTLSTTSAPGSDSKNPEGPVNQGFPGFLAEMAG